MTNFRDESIWDVDNDYHPIDLSLQASKRTHRNPLLKMSAN